jgi:hypothetical protein
MADEEMFEQMEKDARRLPSSAVKRADGRYYPEIMTPFGQYQAGSPCIDYAEAKALGDRLALEAKDHMATALQQWITKKKLRKAKP